MMWALFAIYAALQLVDAVTTYRALKTVSGAYEANPVARWAFDHLGLVGTLMAGKGFGLALAYGAMHLQAPYGAVVLVVLIAFGIYVAVNNLNQLKR